MFDLFHLSLNRFLKSGLLKNFADVTVIETECPDLSKEPFEFPVNGWCSILGAMPRLDKVYNVNSVARKIGLPGAYILGAGATSHKSLGMNADKKTRLAEQVKPPDPNNILGDRQWNRLMRHHGIDSSGDNRQFRSSTPEGTEPGRSLLYTFHIAWQKPTLQGTQSQEETPSPRASRHAMFSFLLIFTVQAESAGTVAVNKSYVASVNPGVGSCLLEKYRDRNNDNNFGLLYNLYACEGKTGKVSIPSVIICLVGLIGSFKSEVPRPMRSVVCLTLLQLSTTSACQLNSDEDVNGWLKFYEMTAPLICQLVFVSHDPGYDLCLEHTHCYSHHVEGGHYHYDTTPNTLEYLGYFHPAEFLYRIDKPSDTHMVGRD
ncbi:ester hydrolase C11orf54 homolog [Xenopus laevis]|uniref:Ester hydrolase C11orf54 homolog n=1 Tax=Xenopus laevis TaxID=8355 RepID=A0A8J1MH04_XENLA|nr:ester hydrolase C11orf54 homolog [Xenopus laevis]